MSRPPEPRAEESPSAATDPADSCPPAPDTPLTRRLWFRASCAVVPFLAILFVASTVTKSNQRVSTSTTPTSATSTTISKAPSARLPRTTPTTPSVTVSSARTVAAASGPPATPSSASPAPGSSGSGSPGSWTNAAGVSAWISTHGQLLGQLRNDVVNVGADTTNGELSSLPGDCAHLEADAQAAQSVPPAPDPLAASLWSQALADFTQASGECTDGLDEHDPSAIAETGAAASSGGSTLVALTK